jgi:hypothetical protein
MSVTSTTSTIYPVITNAVKVERVSSVEYTFTDIVIHSSSDDSNSSNNNNNRNNSNTSNSSSSSNSSNNSNNSNNIKGILKKSEPEKQDNILMCVKLCAFITLLSFTMPLIVCNLYYAYSDNSCVTIYPDHFNVNLKTYLAVDGIIGAIVLFAIIFVVTYLFKEKPNIDDGCLNILGNISTIFGIAWTIIGAVIFWKLIDNTECNKSVYNYIFAQLVIKIICYSLKIISISKK